MPEPVGSKTGKEQEWKQLQKKRGKEEEKSEQKKKKDERTREKEKEREKERERKRECIIKENSDFENSDGITTVPSVSKLKRLVA